MRLRSISKQAAYRCTVSGYEEARGSCIMSRSHGLSALLTAQSPFSPATKRQLIARHDQPHKAEAPAASHCYPMPISSPHCSPSLLSPTQRANKSQSCSDASGKSDSLAPVLEPRGFPRLPFSFPSVLKIPLPAAQLDEQTRLGTWPVKKFMAWQRYCRDPGPCLGAWLNLELLLVHC